MSNSKFPRRSLSERNPYYLSEYREREIIYFCLQYNEWKKRLGEILLRKSGGEWSKPTEEEGDERLGCEERMRIVENACKKVSPDEWKLLLLGVTDPDSNWYNHKLVKGFKCGRDKYYMQKHMVYYFVSQKDRA